jgi:hypothetical protein
VGEGEAAVGGGQGGERLVGAVDGRRERLRRLLQAGGDDGRLQGGLVGEVLVERGGADAQPLGQAAHGEGRRPSSSSSRRPAATASLARVAAVTGSPGWGSAPRPGLEGPVHPAEALQGGPGDEGQQERGQQAAERLLLGHAGPARPGGLDGEAMLAVEQARHQQVAEPAEPAGGLGLQDLGTKGGRPAAGEAHPQLEPAAGGGPAAGLDDERVPVGIGGEVGQHLPDAFR